jgi:isopentenyl-diphosphate Delta-isomerase
MRVTLHNKEKNSAGVSRIVSQIVSFDHEELMLVDANDVCTGYARKDVCHDGQGMRHRAVSVFVFDSEGYVLLQQRSAKKRLWPLYWANTCCSHPRVSAAEQSGSQSGGQHVQEESRDDAATRRLREELGMSVALKHVFTFEYHATFARDGAVLGSEHEVCGVYVGRLNLPRAHIEIVPNENEIAAVKWVSPQELDDAIAADKDDVVFTPWLKLEWARLRA